MLEADIATVHQHFDIWRLLISETPSGASAVRRQNHRQSQEMLKVRSSGREDLRQWNGYPLGTFPVIPAWGAHCEGFQKVVSRCTSGHAHTTHLSSAFDQPLQKARCDVGPSINMSWSGRNRSRSGERNGRNVCYCRIINQIMSLDFATISTVTISGERTFIGI